MKKFLLLLLSVWMVFSMIACDSQPSTVPNADGDTPAEQENQAPKDEETPDGGSTQTPPATVVSDPWFSVATYNIVRCEDQGDPDRTIRPDNIVNFIYDNKIAVCGLQEVEINSSRSIGWATDEYYQQGSHQPKYIAEKLTERTGEQYYWAFAPALQGVHTPAHKDQGIAQYGNALISKFPIEDVRYVQMAVHEVDPNNPATQIGRDGYERRVLLIATLDVDGQKLTVIVSHFGLQESERRLAVQKLKSELNAIDTSVLFMGDLNCVYTSDIIKDIRTVLQPTSTSSTPPSTASGRRIDHIFVSDDIDTKNIKSLPLSYSDHYPVMVKIRMPDAQ